MNNVLNDEFQAATAAAAAAAAAATLATTNKLQKQNSCVESIDSEGSDNLQWPCDDLNRTMRINEDSTEYPQHGWTDITKEFFGACDELNLGELAQDMLFGLFEAMSAIEMMDPKMDVVCYNKHSEPPHTFETAVKAGVLKLDKLSPEELIGIFDALLVCLVSWLEGNSMDQVLFTCLYLHNPGKVHDKALRSYCRAVRSLITLIKNIVMVGSVNEEEDFQLYGNLSLNVTMEDCPSSSVAGQLKEAEEDWVRLSKSVQQPEDIMAVVHRLRFMRHFYQTIYQFDCAMTTAPDDAIINELYKNLNASIELVPQMRRTIEKGTQTEKDAEAPNPMGFSMHIHDRSQPPTFPRSVKFRDRPSSFQFLEELVQSLKFTCKIVKARDFHSALNFFIDFSRKSSLCILSRSVLQGLFMSNRRLVFGTIPLKDFLWDSVRAFSSPPVLNPKHTLAANREVQSYLNTFFQYCIGSQIFTQFIRICGLNLARQREMLSRFIENFDNLQIEAARLDSHLTMLANDSAEATATALKHSVQFATWVLYNCFRAMLLYLMSGFELELYSVHEFLYIYWYPFELLLGFMISALTRAENNLIAQEEYAEQQSKMHGAGSSKSRKPKPKKNKKQNKYHRQEIMFYHAMLSMCGGYCKAMAALTKDGRIRQPMPKFDNEEIRFNRRFAPFSVLTGPPPVSYAEFKSIREHMMRPPSSEIYAVAAKHFDQARNVLEALQNPEQEVLDMLHVAKVNYVVMNVLSKGHQKDSKTQPEFDFSRHRHFPIIKLN